MSRTYLNNDERHLVYTYLKLLFGTVIKLMKPNLVTYLKSCIWTFSLIGLEQGEFFTDLRFKLRSLRALR